MKLSEIKVDEKAKIISVFGDEAFRKKLYNLGIKVNSLVKVLRVAPLLDPLEIDVNGITVAIRKESAENIEVEIIE